MNGVIIVIKLDEDIFEFAEIELKNLLQLFIDQTKLRVAKINDVEIKYYDEGTSDNVLMIIPSSNGSGDTFFRYIQELSKKFRVIVPFYQGNVSLENQYQGFISLLKHLSINNVNLLGFSFGGVIAQLMVKTDPNLVSKLILLDSETKTKYLHPNLVKKYVKSYRRLLRTLKFSSDKWVYRSLKKKIAFDVKVGINENKHFWEAFYTQILNDTPKERIKSLYDNVREFWQEYEFDVSDFEDYDGKVLLLNLAGSLSRVEVQEISHIFKDAEEVIYDETFRMSLISCFDKVIDNILEYIK